MMREADLPLVAMASMNDTHLEELLLINRLSKAVAHRDNAGIAHLLNSLLDHTLKHFGGEEEMMIQKRFPPYLMHKGEHDKALEELRATIAFWESAHDYASLSHYVGETLPQWVLHHIATMDTVTANFLSGAASPCTSGCL